MVMPMGPYSHRRLLVSQVLVVTRPTPAVCAGDRRTRNASLGVDPLVDDRLADLP